MARPSEVEAQTWPEFLVYMRDQWEPGEHIALVAPTGEGKTTFMGGIARTRRFVLGLDIKGGDKTLSSLGWPRISDWPLPRELEQQKQEGKITRLLVGGTGRDAASRVHRRALLRRVLEAVMEEGGWTVLCPDLKALSHPKFGGAVDQIEELLILARDAGVSVVTDWQRPAGVPREAGDQARFLGVAYTRDEDVVRRLAEMMGRSAAEMRGAISALGDLPYGWLVVSRRPRDPIILTRPEKIRAAAPASA